MIDRIDRYGHILDQAIFFGNPDDIIPERFGNDLPFIRDWTEEHNDFAVGGSGVGANLLRRSATWCPSLAGPSTGSNSGRTWTVCTAISRVPTWQWCTEASPPRWNSPPAMFHSSSTAPKRR